MSIRNILLLVFGMLLVLQAGLTVIAFRMERLQESAALMQTRRFESWKLADELRASSDELTRMARTFVVTGDPLYETYFNDILAIRNGTMPRPEGYGGIYWDFVVAAREPVVSTGTPVSLDAMMRQLDFSEEEFAKLREAQDRSDALVKLETVAMNAVKGRFADDAGNFTIEGEPDLEMARRIMHGDEYHRAKAEIMRPISAFFDLLDTRTAREVEAASLAARNGARLTFVLTGVGAALTLVSFFVIVRLTIHPIRRMVDRLRDIAEGGGDLTRRIDEDRRNELGELAHWFNRFVGMVQGIVREVAGNSATVASAATEIAATAREQESAVDRLRGSTRQVAVAVNEISATGRELSTAMAAIDEAARTSASLAVSGRAGLGEMESTMHGLSDAAHAVSATFTALRERAEGIGGIAQAMVKVADQTNLLSVNAAIEAVKARDSGAGFQTVAREIRRLADQSAEASLSIEDDVQAMQGAMSAGAAEIVRFGETVQSVVDRVRQVAAQFGEIIGQVQGLTGQFQSVTAGT
ncbi:MAG: methyl-accepting chemotaxis protein, partial [Phycisphaerales bacterium]|nr:methyl-accepting chemotaxis protein [Phycisphaerales bacterium]